uniref:ATP-grasp domain-containing protein n=1 Tax=Streptomyces sp. NBC_00049 TaxID=2903617 RepID=A0AAU2JNB6_9ACTN
MASSPRTVVLIYQRTSLPWVFESAHRAGIRVVLVPRPDEEVSEARLPQAVSEVLRLDIDGDPEGALATLAAFSRTTPFHGITTLYDPAVPFVAEAARRLGLPGIGVDAARAAQDKRIMRARLADAGLNVPGYVALDGPDSWADAAHLDFPAVVKPARGFSSLGVTKVEDAQSLRGVVEEVWRISQDKLAPGGGLVVEEYLDGPELAVESLAYRGEVRVLSIGYKGEPKGPHFEEGVYRAPADLPSEVAAAVRREVVAAHAALGVTDGPAHTELRLRGGRHPYLLEMGARVGGSGASHYVAAHVSGVDLAADALRIAVGLAPESFAPDAPRPAGAAAANYIVPCGGSGRIVSVDGLDEVRADPRVDHVVQMLFPGDVVRDYPDFTGYPAFVLSRHPSTRDAEEFHQWLESTVRLTFEVEGTAR